MRDDSYRFGFNGKERDDNGEWGNSAHYDYGFRIYDAKYGRFLSQDPSKGKYPHLTPYQAFSNNPIINIDPDGRDHIFYLVFQKGSKNTAAIAARTQGMLDKNDINLKVQVVFTDAHGFNKEQLGKLDGTDALTFIGKADYVNKIYNTNNNEEKSIDYGLTGYIAGHINIDAMTDGRLYGIPKGNDELLIGHIARGAIHEGIGHIFPDTGTGHPDEPPVARYSRYYGVEDQNIMTSGSRTKFSIDPSETGGDLFLYDDLLLIYPQIPGKVEVFEFTITKSDPNSMIPWSQQERENRFDYPLIIQSLIKHNDTKPIPTPKDNFTGRIKEGN